MFIEEIQRWGTASFRAPSATEAVQSCEAQLGHNLPDQLRHLLAEADGIEGEYGLGLLWTTRRIAEDNSAFRRNPDFRRLYMPFEGLVFFSDAGNGDQFAVSLSGNHEVFVWNHVDDSRMWVAPNVMRFLEDWMTGALEI